MILCGWNSASAAYCLLSLLSVLTVALVKQPGSGQSKYLWRKDELNKGLTQHYNPCKWPVEGSESSSNEKRNSVDYSLGSYHVPVQEAYTCSCICVSCEHQLRLMIDRMFIKWQPPKGENDDQMVVKECNRPHEQTYMLVKMLPSSAAVLVRPLQPVPWKRLIGVWQQRGEGKFVLRQLAF